MKWFRKRVLLLILLIMPFCPLMAVDKVFYIKASEPLENQLKYEGAKYIVNASIDLQGKTIQLPYQSELVIKKGVLSNGSIGGRDSFISMRKKCLDNVSFNVGVKSTSKTVKTSWYKTNNINILNSLCNLCPDGGDVVLDKNWIYTISETIKIQDAITIKGKKKTIKLQNPDNCAISAFDAVGGNLFSLSSVIIDGSWNPSKGHGKYTDQYLMSIVGVENVIIKNCKFKNAMVVITSWEKKPDAMILISDYKNVVFDRNQIVNCHTTEGLVIRNTVEKNGIATITNNIFDFVFTSSCLNAFYGKYIVKDNYFSTSRGSSLNVFGHDCVISDNLISGSQYSCAIDLSENGFFDYPSQNISITNNTAYYCYDGFLNGSGIENIQIIGNTFDCTVYKQERLLDGYDKLSVKPKRGRKTDKIMVFTGKLKDIDIRENSFKGGQALLFLEDDAERKDIKIVNNIIELDETTSRSAIVFNSIDGLQVKGNVFLGAGCTPGYLKKPAYIATLPVHKSNRAISNITIEENQFSSKSDSCYIFTQSVYDRNIDINFLELSNINVLNNVSNVPASLIFVNKSFSDSDDPGITVMNNDFKGGSVMANTAVKTDMEKDYNENNTKKPGKNEEFKMNTIVKMNGKRYYVVAGGKTSEIRYVEDKDYIRNGAVVLREMK